MRTIFTILPDLSWRDRTGHRAVRVAAVLGLLGIMAFFAIGCERSPGDAEAHQGGTGLPAEVVASSGAMDFCDDPDAPDAAAGAELPMRDLVILSNDGSYRLTIEPELGLIPRNRYFALRLTVEGVHGPIAREGVMLSVSAAMPHHEHGLNSRPIVDVHNPDSTVDGVGLVRARVHGLLLHMPGRWEVYIDMTESGVTERAQFGIDLP